MEKRMTENPWPTCSHAACAPYRGRHIELMTQKTTHFGKKQGWGPVANLPLAVLDKPLGRILLGGLSSMELWEDLSGWLTVCAPLIQAARVPIDSTCHCLKSKAAWQWHWRLVFILYSLYFGVVFGGLIELLLFFLFLFFSFQIQLLDSSV